MRIVAGKYRGKRLYSPSDDAVRPTTDRIKETVFNIIQWDVAGARVLDLFAGSGALGIECISRGAEEVVFVDRSPSSIALIKENLKGIEGNYRVVCADFLGVLRAGSDKFDLIFVDPPFRSGLGETAVCAALDSQRLAEGGTIVYEHSTELPFVPTRDDITVRTKRMGTVTVDFVRRKKTALFAGTFDPVTKGHIAVIDEALRVFDEVTAGILVNPDKDCFFTPEERLEILNAALSDKKGVKTLYSENMAVDVAREIHADALVRGVRGEGDSAYENEMARFNLEHGFDTVFFSPSGFEDFSSTRAREELLKGDFHSIPPYAIIKCKEIMQKKESAKA